jgi:nucleoside 2-deoxyribosyltransferase
MKFFISYRLTGEDPVKLKPMLESIQSAITAGGHKNYCSFQWQSHFEANDFSPAQIIAHSFNELDHADALLAFINSPEKSEGMLLEIGYALAKKKKLFVLVCEDIPTAFVRQMADQVVEFRKVEDLPRLTKHFL